MKFEIGRGYEALCDLGSYCIYSILHGRDFRVAGGYLLAL